MITLDDKKKKFLEINSGNLSPEGKLKEIESYLAEADKQNEQELKDQEKQAEQAQKEAEKKQEKELADEQKAKDKLEADAKKEESEQKKLDAQEKSDSSTKKVEVVGAELITIKGEKGDPGADSDVPGPTGKDGKNGKDGKPGLDGQDGKDGVDGKNAEPSEVVPLVMNQLKLPEVQDLVLDNGEKIVAKINELPLDEDKKIDAQHIKGLPIGKNGRPNVGGIRYFEQLADVSIVPTKKRQDLLSQYNTTNNRWQDGVALTVSAVAPTNPQTLDIWIDIS